MSDCTFRSDGLCDRCSRFLHFKGGEHGFYGETTDKDGTVHIDFCHTRDGKEIQEVEPPFQLEDDYPAMTELNRSASKGCRFCDLLLNTIQEQGPKVEENMVLLIKECSIREGPHSTDKGYNAGVRVHWVVIDSKTMDEPSQRWSDQTFFRLLANQDTMAAKYLRLLYAPFHPSLLCSENITRIRQSLLDCSENHQQCAAYRAAGHWKNQALPSRLLQIRKDQTGYRIRLVEMQSRTSPEPGALHPEYAALSYCWGDQEFIKSTPENITNHYDTIMFSDLPPGFRDTVELCWGIGIFYLWIDSLCIIQGDQSDWDRESARMKDVYANASLTIILASTDSPLTGLSNASTEYTPDVRVSYRLDDDHGPEIAYFIQSSPSVARDPDSLFRMHSESEVEHLYELSIYCSEWMHRGWTFQESYLSTKKLLICTAHTDFSCRTSSRLQGILRICRPLRDLGKLVLRPGAGDWHDLIGHYSGRKLSRSEDKLPAISAVASLMGKGSGDYVAGLWTNSLMRGLLWAPGGHFFSDGLALKRQTTYRGPTWSWCAYDGLSSYHLLQAISRSLRKAFNILEIRWTLAEPTAIYGRLSTADGDRAYLMIRAKVAWVTIQSQDIKLDSGVAAAMEFGGTQRTETGLRNKFLIDCGKTEGFESPQRVAAMLVAKIPNSNGWELGLFLRPVPSLGPVITYERVGCFRRRGKDHMFKYITEVHELCLV